jgi:hypothetical protein
MWKSSVRKLNTAQAIWQLTGTLPGDTVKLSKQNVCNPIQGIRISDSWMLNQNYIYTTLKQQN